MNKNYTYTVILTLFLGLSVQLQAHESDNDSNKQEFETKLYEINNSGVTGKVEIKLINDNEIKISIKANGLEVDTIHPQHIHGFNNPLKDSVCPDISNDVNGDGIVTIDEAAPVFGPILLPLVPFDTVTKTGKIKYKASFTINPDTVMLLEKRTIVLHGKTVNGQYIPSLPVACGQIVLED